MDKQGMHKAQQLLREYWGFPSFRDGQDRAIQSVVQQHNTVVLLPTGGGKSLCYQIPAMVFEGLTLVISPLIALMQDQVQQLNERGISATFINSTISSYEIEQRLVNARNGMYDLLYCAPERLKTPLWQAEMERMRVDLIAIDEAHCISEWGHDFRPAYRDILPALESIAEQTTWIALTATATPKVRADICENLGFEDPAIISKGFDRPNLKWWVTSTNKKEKKLMQAVSRIELQESGIIYGGTRKRCEHLAETIVEQQGISAKAYHAGMEAELRESIQDEWIAGTLSLVVATNAFGMGIDKADCRYVIHYEMPYSLEAYYQQAGRAGRDGLESFPLLLFSPSDLQVAQRRIKDSYPGQEQLQHTYDSLCDSFSLAIGAEMEELQEADIQALSKRSGYPERLVQSALKVLRQLEIIQLVDHVKSEVGVQFVASRDLIRQQIDENTSNKKAHFLDTLFRQYGGEAFREIKYLNFEYLQNKLQMSSNTIRKGLRVLQDHDQLLSFEIRGERPLVKLVEERQSTLRLSKEELEGHRNTLLKKLKYMQGYIQTDNCREVYIRNYFGEQQVLSCGHCDNCLNSRINRQQLVDTDLQSIRQALQKGGKTIGHLCRQFGWSKSRVKKTLSHLMREQKVQEEAEKYIWKG